MEAAGGASRGGCASSIHLRIHCCSERGDDHSCESAPQLPGDAVPVETRSRYLRHVLAAAVPRYGTHRLRLSTGLCRLYRSPDVAACIPAAACPVASGYFHSSCVCLGRTE